MRKILLLLIVVLMGCANGATFEQAVEKIKEQNEKLHQVVATKNVELLKEVYASDGHFMAPEAGIVSGRDSIISLWKSGLDNMIEMHSKTVSINGTVDVVYEVGTVETKIKVAEPDSVFIYKAKYSNVWHRDEQGVYRLVVDIWNTMD